MVSRLMPKKMIAMNVDSDIDDKWLCDDDIFENMDVSLEDGGGFWDELEAFGPISNDLELPHADIEKTYPLPFFDGISTFQSPSPISVLKQELAICGETRTKRSRTETKRRPRNLAHNPLPAMPLPICSTPKKTKEKKRKKLSNLANISDTKEEPAKKCTHCEITKTPQWRAGPMGPKTLCNACGVRYRSGRLFPEYRPAASPTFVPSLHSNSHRKVLEMRNKCSAPTVADDVDGRTMSAPREYRRAMSAPLEFVPMSSNSI